ncbi:olfactory receptor 5V1-like [Bombina bombina]|uniref:olfactory receptor 5V1-like n=1 Tax=Bombina bombina TaxID=8345 RepID=UPI00235AB8DF|nr:olfactory receptor 5V1-like [Bombina bombina]
MSLDSSNKDDGHNKTSVNEFILLGLLHLSNFKSILFVIFFTIFLMTMVGNSLIITAIRMDPYLHTPMYFFLANLSILEMCYTSITLPNVLLDILQSSTVISFMGCMVQVCLFTLCATVECILLAAMACDRYVAICRPLHYTSIINKMVCINLALFAWANGVFNSTVQTILTSRLPFCGANSIDRLYCEVQPLIRLSCADTQLNDILATISAAVFGVSCLVFILTSYVFIISAILKIPSREGRRKAFSTCASHITVVILYYGALIFMYLLPKSSTSQKLDTAVSMIYSTLTPVLNPIIYSLRNQQVKEALKKTMKGNLCASWAV